MSRHPTRWLLGGLLTVSALLYACGGGGDDSERSNVLTVDQGTARVPAGNYALDMSDAAAAPARIATAGQLIEGLTPEHADFDFFVLFRVDDPSKFAVFFYPGMDSAGTTTYGCHSANWALSDLQAIDAAPEIDLDLGAMGGAVPVCPSNVEIDANAHRIRIRQLALQRVSAPAESIVISTTLQYKLP
ncbi:hypothetical protein [Aquabacterium parvum]|uniref:hypothetical protein n=1 Tax=Aquabacterium parvum TaxID=70584 RepID=UPI000718E9DA|nr:hypothetical protein [Aquabacterium parvum]